jgi:Cu-Zn family superoxide dismutase
MYTKVKTLSYAMCVILAIVLLLSFVSCQPKAKITDATCVIKPTEGSQVKGTVIFKQTPIGVKITADFTGLTPGLHGFHIHEFGDCSAPDGTSAGGHFNPSDQPHGAMMDASRHAGDMGNIMADAAGNSHIEFTDKMMTLNGENSIINKGMIIHKNEDDLKTQPTGNAGARVGCGTIVIAK